MYHIKNDKRARASTELICAGLLACMKEKPFARITITDVQRASTVSRSTFYRNFDCLEDVLALLCDRGFQAVFSEYNALPPEQRGSLAKAVFQYWFRNSAVLEALVQIHRTDILFDSLRRSSGLIQALQPMADDPARFDYFVAIITSSMIGVLTVWVEHGKTEDGDPGAARLRKPGLSSTGKGRVSVCFYGTMRVPLSPRMAAGACSSEAITARRRQPLRTNCTAAATFGCMEPAPNCPARR